MITTVKTSSVVQGMPKYRSMLAGNPAYIPSSYESIATATGTGSSGTITFSSIPSTFKHLQIRGIVRTNDTNGNTGSLDMRFNSDSGSNYARHLLRGNGTAVSASGVASTTTIDCGFHTCNLMASNIMAVVIVDILDYASTSKYKTARIFNGNDFNTASTEASIFINSGLWQSTNAINSISFIGTGLFLTSTTFSLYGIKEA